MDPDYETLAPRIDLLDAQVDLLGAKIEALNQMMESVLAILPAIAPVDKVHDKEALLHSVPDLQLLSISTKPTESNEVWTKWAWRIIVKNNTNKAIDFQAHIQFRDAESFALDDSNSDILRIAHDREEAFTDYKLVNAAIADQITSVWATLNPVQ